MIIVIRFPVTSRRRCEQITALGAQHLQQVEGARAGADHQQMRAKQGMPPQQGKAGARRGGTGGKAAKGQDAIGDGNLHAENGRDQAGHGYRKRGHHGDAAKRLLQAADTLLAVQSQRIQKAQLDEGKERRLKRRRGVQDE